MLNRFFLVGQDPYPFLWQQHDPWLVALSVLIDVGASIVALHMATLARDAHSTGMRQLALASGALALGAGIWAMHFVGMLAFRVCAQGSFDPWLTATSVIPSLAASWVALRLLARPEVRWPVLVSSGVLMGAGIGLMHYLGMEASEVAPILRYDPLGFGISIVVAVVLAVLALWVRFGLQGWLRQRAGLQVVLAGLVMGTAITGMHYTGMAAIRFIYPDAVSSPEKAIPEHQNPLVFSNGGQLNTDIAAPALDADEQERQQLALGLLAEQENKRGIDQLLLPWAIAAVTFILGLLALAVNAGVRFRQMFLQAQASENLQRAVQETAVDAVIRITGSGIVQAFNPAAERMFGWQASEVIGRNINMLMPEPYRSAHDGYLHRHLSTGHSSIIGKGREVHGQRKDGSIFPARLAVGRVQHDAAGQATFVGFLTDLSSYYALERERQKDAEQLRSLVGNLPGVAFRRRNNPDWQMEFISEAVFEITGWAANDFLEQRVHWSEIIHPTDFARMRDIIDYAVAQEKPYHVEYRITHRNGQTRWLFSTGRALSKEDGHSTCLIDGVITDITESKARNAELTGLLQALERSEAMAEFTPHGDFLAATPQFLQLFGYSLDELLGVSHALLCAPDYAHSATWRAFWQNLAAGEFASGEFERVGRNGQPVWLHASYNPILDAEGKVFKVVKMATDLSHRHAMEQDLREAKERAEAAAAARTNFLANMSHEIRTPMNAIIGFTDVLMETPLSPEQRQQLGTVQRSARSLLHLLNDILDVAKLDKGAMVLEEADFNLHELCRQMLDSLRVQADKKGLFLRLDYAPSLPHYWVGDAFRLQQVLINLVGNAIKFTHRGGITLHARFDPEQPQWLCLEVQDSGIGMNEAALARVFESFSQADASTTRHYGGTGLGTTIARDLVGLMHGHISVSSQPGQGSSFYIHLPLPQAADQAPRPSSQPGPNQPSLPPLRILAVDDVPTNLEVLELALGRQGHQVQSATSGVQALQVLQQPQPAIDLVLMDLHMPELDGLSTTRQLRTWEAQQQPPRTPLPVIALSASVLQQDRDDAQAAGMQAFASKPVDMAELLGCISQVLGLNPSAAPAVHTPASTTASAPAPSSAPTLIDWQRGSAVWGDASTLQTAITRWLPQGLEQAQTLQADCTTPEATNWPAIAQQAHRLRGAAGNLALVQVQAHAAQLEAAAQQQTATAAQQSLAALPQALAAVQAALAPHHPDTAPNSITDLKPRSPGLGPQRQAEVQATLEQCIQMLAQGELPEEATSRLEQLLGNHSVQPVKEALEAFDFEGAAELLMVLKSLTISS